ncbi:protein cereblon [Ischnura elegans]|uniref:protein cereblon n=1 Tax=Ischnura elegans TaxID=197161 RepID=UPI001ED87148|nr:protein cereblon [Ischnura elegans]
MDGNEDDWISESDALDESDDELILGDHPTRQGSHDGAGDDEEIESEEEAEALTFDVALPVKHAYLGSNLQEARGHTLMDLEAPEAPLHNPGASNLDSSFNTSSSGMYGRACGQICQIPILPPYSGVSMALVPGQTLPMTLFHPQAISMLRVALERGRTFGIVAIRNDSEDEEDERGVFLPRVQRNRFHGLARRFANEDYPLWDVGTTAEIYEFQGDDEDSLMTQDENRMLAGFTLKAKGSQRFRLLGIHRQVDGNLLAKVQILPEIILPHPLHECRLTCLDCLRYELPGNPKVKDFGDRASRQSSQTESQVKLVASICSLIKEKRKGDDSESWEKICEVKRLYHPSDLGSGPERVMNHGKGGEKQVVGNEEVGRTDGNISIVESQGANLFDCRRKDESSQEIADLVLGATSAEAEVKPKNEDQGQGLSQKPAALKEHLLGVGFLKGKGDDSKSGKFRGRVRVDGKWCRRRDSALTAWPDWIYSMYDGPTLVKRMHQEFKALHLSKKRDRSMLLRSSLGLKSSEKALDRSFPCLSEDPVELSFWVVQNLPLDDKQRVKLLRMNSAIQRLRWELGILELCHQLTCCNCGQKIADQRHAFCMSVAGPQGTYVNPGGYVHEALTLSKAKGLKVVTHPPSTEHSWFPGYAWSIVECSRCTQHMGWLFTVAPGANQQLRPHQFWGICRKSLVTGHTKRSEEEFFA